MIFFFFLKLDSEINYYIYTKCEKSRNITQYDYANIGIIGTVSF